MIERIERFAPSILAIVALLTGGAWLASHGGPPQPQPPFQQPQPPPQPEPPPKTSSCNDCGSCGDCADCASACDGCEAIDVSDCDCSGVDCSGIDCTLALTRARSGSTGFLVLLLPLALLDAWRRRLKPSSV